VSNKEVAVASGSCCSQRRISGQTPLNGSFRVRHVPGGNELAASRVGNILLRQRYAFGNKTGESTRWGRFVVAIQVPGQQLAARPAAKDEITIRFRVRHGDLLRVGCSLAGVRFQRARSSRSGLLVIPE
jgi:hypothetical protein